ncbi:hypothetical protein EV679_0642 [Kerstersia gyiorum]|uniref:Sulphur transport domain-containing protein n=1 Tax=Kerstersia gyiorum TaxID=206506 RepID=A0A4Q7MZ46_9BURK|nr:YeeE/YedE family protein [Kerstersia gyiorum]KAB0544941.1 YeeE/YedE family protein [Kerstersia gyiorum]RZS73450.1 hypothetical protein EV679_0642 [Kerstersia gyiorum]
MTVLSQPPAALLPAATHPPPASGATQTAEEPAAWRRPRLPALAAATLVACGLAWWAWQLQGIPGTGRGLAFSLLAGAFFGFALQRSRFCFYCITRDYLAHRDARGLLGLIAALALGLLGYYAVFGAFLPVPAPGRLPPGAHIGPVSWVLALGAATFGLGMAISGSCISAHLYRLGEGAFHSLFALLGALAGFGLGFVTWNPLYTAVIRDAPVIWLPHHLGYGGSLALQLTLLAALAAWLLRNQGRHHAAASGTAAPVSLLALLFSQRWPTYAGGLLIAGLGAMAYFRVAPLGVTAELGSIARTLADSLGALPARLEGLDGFAGCATVIKQSLLSNNGVFVAALVMASFASAILAGDFLPVRLHPGTALRHALGGLLMGWGGMLALGCTIGTLLSGIMAGAASGWIFALFCLVGAWLGWRLRQRA